MLSIREVKRQDTPLLLELIKGLAAYEKLAHEVVTDAEKLAENLFAANSTTHAVLAEQDGRPIGFALYFFNFSTFLGRHGLYLEDLFVKPEFRGGGAGKALLIRLAQIARERNCGRMEWSVLDWNQPAIDFYRKLGALPMNEWTVYRLTQEGIDRLAQGG